jgi:hypothetical protein
VIIEGDQDIYGVAWAPDLGLGDPGLGPSGTAKNLRREGGKGEGVESSRRRGPGHHFGCGYNALSAFTGKSDDNLIFGHRGEPPDRGAKLKDARWGMQVVGK